MNTSLLRRDSAVALGLSLAFVALLIAVVIGQPSAGDRWLAGRVQAIAWGPLEVIPRLGSDVGGGVYGFYVLPAAVGAVLAVRRQWVLLGLLAGVFALHYLLISPKQFIAASRPSPAFGVEGAGGLQSFPSGHVEWATSFYGFVAYVAARRWPALRWPIFGAFVVIVLGTALGRIELGRHWPIDTLAGALAGLFALRLLVSGHRAIEAARSRSARRAAIGDDAGPPLSTAVVPAEG